MRVELLQDILYAAAPLIALTNPVAELPIFLGIVAERSRLEKLRAAFTVALGVLVVLVVTALSGLRILEAFGVSLAAFRAAGGLLLVLMGLEMVQGREPTLQSAVKTRKDSDDGALWVPLVMPMLAGPGAIVTTISLSIREADSAPIPVATIAAILISAFVVLVTLSFATWIGTRVGPGAGKILSRFSGLILVAIGFQMGFTGIAEFFESWTPELDT